MSSNHDFRSIVCSAMSAIIDTYGFRVVESESDNYFVRLDSAHSSIQGVYDICRAHEVAVTISEMKNGVIQQRIPYNLGEVFREFDVPESDKHSFCQSASMVTVNEFLIVTAGLLLRYCAPILRGEQTALSAVSARRIREAAAYTSQIQIASIHQQADDAWRDQRYEEFVNLMQVHKEWLSELDRKKLDNAFRKIPLN